ncbi:MAG: hypothetical protein Q4C64_05550 [Erysipelotrichia bacterium]|nr:hypothetical protein [Erysipelotrichia bacterium]
MLKKIYLLVQSFIYILFIYMDFTYQNSSAIKYCGIIINFIFSLYLYFRKENYSILFVIALFLTTVADYFLLVKDSCYSIGVACFCIVQLLYAYKISRFSTFPIRMIVIVLLIFFLPLFQQERSILNILAIISFVNLTVNVIACMLNKQNKLFIAFILFWLCDLSVGIYNLQIPLVDKFCAYSMWIFYFPSQILLTLSGEEQ